MLCYIHVYFYVRSHFGSSVLGSGISVCSSTQYQTVCRSYTFSFSLGCREALTLGDNGQKSVVEEMKARSRNRLGTHGKDGMGPSGRISLSPGARAMKVGTHMGPSGRISLSPGARAMKVGTHKVRTLVKTKLCHPRMRITRLLQPIQGRMHKRS